MDDSDQELVAAPAERSPPFSAEAEEHVIATCLLDHSETIGRAIGAGVTSDSFYSPANRLLWRLIVELWSARSFVTLEMIAEELKTRRQLEMIGGFPYLMQVTGKIPTTAHAGYFIGVVREKQTLRNVISAATGIVERAYAYTGNLDEFVTTAMTDMNIALGISDAAEEKFQAVAGQLAVETEKLMAGEVPPLGVTVPWGLVDIDKGCGQMSKGELVILAGRPSTGKSALADQIAFLSASRGGPDRTGAQTLMFTYEMTKRDKAIRMAQQVTGYNYAALLKLHKAEQQKFVDTFKMIRDLKTLHVFERDVSLVRLVARCRAHAARSHVNLIVVDFLQYLARLEPMVGRERTDEKIGRLTAACKDIAKELECPVVLLSSLNREGEKEGRPPRMSDLRASGEIESDADVIALLHWPKEHPYTKTEQDPHDDGQNYFAVEFNQEKGRNKGVHGVHLQFDRHATRFQNLSQ